MVQTLELGFVDWSGLSFIADEEANTLEKLVKGLLELLKNV